MLRWKVAGVAVTLGLLVGGGAVMRVGASVLSAGSFAAPPKVLQVFYTSPVLVRAGERVRIPVDVVCSTEAGDPCPATASIAVSAAGRVQTATVEAAKGLEFDVTAPARRALGTNDSGRVDFALRAESAGRTVRLPAGAGSMLGLHVTRSMPEVHVPAVPFGKVRKPETVLNLPWGSGPTRAGLAPGLESQTLGPSAFDVDGRGRIHLVDGLQHRVAVFDGGRLVGETRGEFGPRSVISVAADGSAFVLDARTGRLSVRKLSARGGPGDARDLGPGIVSQIRVVKGEAYANVLPLDGWVNVATGAFSVGMPVRDGGELIRVGRDDSIRLGTVRGGAVVDAVEIRSSVKFGSVALAETYHGGYLLVVHTWRETTQAADQYQVIRVAPDHSIRTFAVRNRSFAGAPPLARFRLGPDGALYQMTSSPNGIRIVRFDLEEDR